MASALVPVGRIAVATPTSMALAINQPTVARDAVDARIQPIAAGIIADDSTVVAAAAAAVSEQVVPAVDAEVAARFLSARLVAGPAVADELGVLLMPSAFSAGKFSNAMSGVIAAVSEDAQAYLLANPPSVFTVDGWARLDAAPSGVRVLWSVSTSHSSQPWWIGVGADGKLRHQGAAGAVIALQDGDSLADGAWHHVAAQVVYSSGTGFTVQGVWLDGVPLTLAASGLTLSVAWRGQLVLGSLVSGVGPNEGFLWPGQVDEWRYRASAPWTPGVAFTPPTAAGTVGAAGDVIMHCDSFAFDWYDTTAQTGRLRVLLAPSRFTTGRFGKALTGVIVTPSADTAAHVAANAPSVFTADGWVKLDANPPGTKVFWSISTANLSQPWWIGVGTDGKLRHQGSGGTAVALQDGASLADGGWHHVAVQVAFGTGVGFTTQGVWLDGDPLTLAASGLNLFQNWGTRGEIVIGSLVSGAGPNLSFLWPGALDEWRYRPVAAWTPGVAFTPPTVAAITDTDGEVLAPLDSFAYQWAGDGFGYPPRPDVGDGQVVYVGPFEPTDQQPYDEWIRVSA